MTIFCPNCLHDWSENNNIDKIKANGIQCKYCNVFFIDTNFVIKVLKENGIKDVIFEFRNIDDEDV